MECERLFSDRKQYPRTAVLVILMLLTAPSIAYAHGARHSETSAHGAGIEIAAITHSDMALVAPYYSAIVGLADRQTTTDERFRRILNFTKIQNTYCLWGIVPGSISDEESAFNPCSHAYLAGAHALLENLKGKSASAVEALAISRSLEADRENSPLLEICQSSADAFSTAELLKPIRTADAAMGLLAMIFVGGLAGKVMRKARKRTCEATHPLEAADN